LIGFVVLSSDSALVGMIRSAGTDVIETSSSETRRGAVVGGMVVVTNVGDVGAPDVDGSGGDETELDVGAVPA
jgi:hypothetical protein